MSFVMNPTIAFAILCTLGELIMFVRSSVSFMLTNSSIRMGRLLSIRSTAT